MGNKVVLEARGSDKVEEKTPVLNSKPAVFVPTLYFTEGLPYTIVNLMSVVLFKNLGASNEIIGLTSFLYIPWTIKFFWAPFVDIVSTRRQWVLTSQFVLTLLIGLASACMFTPFAIEASVAVFALIAIASATQDIAIDGFYLDALAKDKQAFYVGVRNAAYKIAWLFGSGGLVYLAGISSEKLGVHMGWFIALVACAALMGILALFHSVYLPHPQLPITQTPVTQVPANNAKLDTLNTNERRQLDGFSSESRWDRMFIQYFGQPGIVAIVTYILVFRLGDALMLKMAQPFLLDDLAKGGLGMSVSQVGIIYGTVGTVFLLAGGILGGLIVSRDGLRKWLLPTAVIQNSAILLYYLLAHFKPGFWWVAAVNSIEQFAYGLGVAAYTVFLLATVKEEYKASHYAIATGLMALGVMLPGAASGFLQGWLGYESFFLLSFLAAIPGFVSIFFLPLERLLNE